MTEILVVAEGPFEQWMTGRVFAESGVLRDQTVRLSWCDTSDHARTETREREFDAVFCIGDFDQESIRAMELGEVPTFVVSDSQTDLSPSQFFTGVLLDEFDGDALKKLLVGVSPNVEA